MSKKITISGEIGWDYTAANIRDSLSDAAGSDLDIDIVTPGGDVFDGIEIHNAIRDYKREYPKSQIMGTLKDSLHRWAPLLPRAQRLISLLPKTMPYL